MVQVGWFLMFPFNGNTREHGNKDVPDWVVQVPIGTLCPCTHPLFSEPERRGTW